MEEEKKKQLTLVIGYNFFLILLDTISLHHISFYKVFKDSLLEREK